MLIDNQESVRKLKELIDRDKEAGGIIEREQWITSSPLTFPRMFPRKCKSLGRRIHDSPSLH